jgi:hypothetical protein
MTTIDVGNVEMKEMKKEKTDTCSFDGYEIKDQTSII